LGIVSRNTLGVPAVLSAMAYPFPVLRGSEGMYTQGHNWIGQYLAVLVIDTEAVPAVMIVVTAPAAFALYTSHCVTATARAEAVFAGKLTLRMR